MTQTETHSFQAEVSRLLEIVAHSLYSEREVFLRELISNASDACDRLRYEALTSPGLLADTTELVITLTPDKARRTLTIADNGIGMNHQELLDNLGTIAKSGTGTFLKTVTDKGSMPSLIGQFGVGFYSAFMVADEVQVRTRRAGVDEGWLWISSGQGSFTIESCADLPVGTSITLRLKDGADEFLEQSRLKEIVTRYSDHIAFPIRTPGEDAALPITLNRASALWLRPAKEISAEQYKEFYHHNAHAFDDPWLTLHWHSEGVIDYRALLFVPSSKPMDLFDPQRRHHVKLYARRVFVTDAAEGLLPPYLRFMRGLVDSEDLPLNVSREMLQHNPVLAKISSGLTKRILGDLAKEAKNDEKRADYDAFLDNFGAVLKEGLYEDRDHKDLIFTLCRFHTTKTATTDGHRISLDDYIARMQPGQTKIYTISGTDQAALTLSPQLEGFRARGIEVLLLTDPVDDFWLAQVMDYKGKPFQSVTRGSADLEAVAPTDKPEKPAADEAPPAEMTALVSAIKSALGPAVSDVRVSKRLTSSAVCLVASDGDIDINLERLLRAHKQLPQGGITRVLEINPQHDLIRTLARLATQNSDGAAVQDMAHLLLDQARILEGEPLPDPVGFANRMTQLLGKGLAA